MKLEQFQKDDLKSLTEHRGFKILEELVKEMREDLYRQFDEAPMWDANIQMNLSLVQNQLKGAIYLIDTAKAKTKSIAKKS